MAEEKEYIRLTYSKPRRYRWSTGKYLGKAFKEARDNKKLITNRCPKCRELFWPPEVVCGRCKVFTGEDWVEMSDKGTVLQYSYMVTPMWNPHMGKRFANPHPLALIKLDNACHIYHFLEEQDPERLPSIKRVQAVWKEEGRGQGMRDILYFRAIEE